ncbi:hypothetical protein GCM10009038_37290 [Salinicola rhizosphaerae]|uniref:Uncharacterized protein n=1 Tax=Salinicola rhizosphaerae TaxID=1443141 RepID=A0ABQ3EHD5_9GAMM|nr:hypothetical protein GCM10009038_37290 [Salinicola rhizosphaerae]
MWQALYKLYLLGLIRHLQTDAFPLLENIMSELTSTQASWLDHLSRGSSRGLALCKYASERHLTLA